jgi:YesN/AraC family two-component response regulator
MTIQDWASLIVAILTIVSSIAFAIKWMVTHYLSELKPNSGSSLKDQVSRLEKSLEEQRIESNRSRVQHEAKIDKMYDILLKHIDSNNN